MQLVENTHFSYWCRFGWYGNVSLNMELTYDPCLTPQAHFASTASGPYRFVCGGCGVVEVFGAGQCCGSVASLRPEQLHGEAVPRHQPGPDHQLRATEQHKVGQGSRHTCLSWHVASYVQYSLCISLLSAAYLSTHFQHKNCLSLMCPKCLYRMASEQFCFGAVNHTNSFDL